MAQIQNPHFRRGSWFEGNTLYNTNNVGRRIEDVGDNRPPHKRRIAYFPNSYYVLPVVRRTEDEGLCMPSLIQDNNSGNGLRVVGEETNCSEGSDSDCYYTREAIEKLSPSRRDGIDLQKETFLRCSYVVFLQTLGMRLQMPQTTIATAIVLCHRFFLRRSHASHDRFGEKQQIKDSRVGDQEDAQDSLVNVSRESKPWQVEISVHINLVCKALVNQSDCWSKEDCSVHVNLVCKALVNQSDCWSKENCCKYYMHI